MKNNSEIAPVTLSDNNLTFDFSVNQIINARLAVNGQEAKISIDYADPRGMGTFTVENTYNATEIHSTINAFSFLHRNLRVKKTITLLQDPVWLANAGMSKGIHHDRQHLGIILPAGRSFRIRNINKDATTALKLRLLNDDEKTEAAYFVGSDWVTVCHDSTAIPFIDTPYVNGCPASYPVPVVEYEYLPAEVKTLPVYRLGDSNESDFFNIWDAQEAEFALLESSSVRILVPGIDKEIVRHLARYNNILISIDRLLMHYDAVMAFFNKLAGLAFDAEQQTDRNSSNKYFVKADKSGPGSGYYSDLSTTESGNSNSVAAFWLLDKHNWGRLHEIAHGYEARFVNGDSFSTREVWNNIYAASWQYAEMGSRVFQQGWLYDYDNAEQLFATISDYLTDRLALNNWGLREKLYFMMLIKDKAGDAAFIHFNQEYRKKAADPDFIPEKHHLLDMLAESFALKGGIDVSAFIELVGGVLSERQRSRNAFSGALPVLPLNQIVTHDIKRIQAALNLDSPFCLVSADDLHKTGLKGNLSLSLDISAAGLAQFYGEELLITSGKCKMFRARIQNDTVIFHNVPAGLYHIHAPGGKSSKYRMDRSSVIVRPGDSEAVLYFTEKTVSTLVSQQFALLGLGDAQFASVTIDAERSVLEMAVTQETPHSYFSEKKYAAITLKNSQGEIIATREIMGDKESLIREVIPFAPGWQLDIWHAEPVRLRELSGKGIVDTQSQLNSFIMTPAGLQNTALKNDPLADLSARIDEAAAWLRQQPDMLQDRYIHMKDDIWLAIAAFSHEEAEILRSQYQDVLPTVNTAPLSNSQCVWHNDESVPPSIISPGEYHSPSDTRDECIASIQPGREGDTAAWLRQMTAAMAMFQPQQEHTAVMRLADTIGSENVSHSVICQA